MFREIRHVIFDLNGTLIVGEYPCWSEIFEHRLGLKKRLGKRLSLEKFRAMAKGLDSFEETISSIYEVKDKGIKKIAFKLYTSNIRLRENAIDVLERLRKKYELILCSDTIEVAKEVVKKFSLKKYFIKLFYSCDLGYLKDEENFWRKILSHFPSSDPSKFLMIGDNPRADIYWPKKMGMHTILIDSGISAPDDFAEKPRGLVEERPEHFIKGLEEILKFLDLC